MKTIKTVKNMLPLIAATFFFGCATIMGGTSQDVTFNSNPEGAKVTLDGKVLGKTPLTISLSSKKKGQSLDFEKEGHKKLSMKMGTKTNGMFWGNIIFGGLIGSTTDGLSGAIYQYSPDQYMVTLEPSGTGSLDGTVSKTLAQKTKDFIVIGHDNIIVDLSRGNGPHLASLLRILDIPENMRSEVISNMLTLSSTHTDVPEFADEVVRLYL
ncbi:MAG: PEGA domain-containing protein [Waddliaceae bacterium]